MAAPRNDEMRTRVRTRYAELHPDLITKAATLKALATEFGVSAHTITYYLRDSVATQKRVEYSELIKQRVALMDLKEIKEYAARIKRPWQRLYQISLDARKPKPLEKVEARRQDIINTFQVFNFSSPSDLQAFGFKIENVREARKLLRQKWGLSLAAPNFLVHKTSGKAYAMNYQEQAMILRQPVVFVTERAGHIGKNWQPFDDTKTWTEMLDLS